MPRPAIVLTGASGLVGRHLLGDLKDEYRIFAIARRSQRECGAPTHPNIAWMRVDIGDREALSRTFREIMTAGGAKILIHLAAYYDFTGERNPEYRRTNIEGTRNVLDAAEGLGLERFVFASSVAACSFPRSDGPITEATPPDGEHIYAWSKREGERLVLERARHLGICIVRFGAIYSDWCEYPPLYIFLNTWTSSSWRSRILAGRGQTAIPYIHIRDIVSFMRSLLARRDRIEPGEVFVASTMGCASHSELFRLATYYYFGKPRRPIQMPASLCAVGLRLMTFRGKLLGDPPFERPWMSRYVDRRLEVDNSKTRARLEWIPAARYQIDRRLRFLIEALKSEPVEWTARNVYAMRKVTAHPDLRIYRALMEVEDQIVESLAAELSTGTGAGASVAFRSMGASDFGWFVRLVYRLLMNSVQSGNRMLILSYFEVTGWSRFQVGFTSDDLCLFLARLNTVILERLGEMQELKPLGQEMHDRISVPLEFGKDEVREQFERFLRGPTEGRRPDEEARDLGKRTAKEMLEDTIWKLLAQRR